MRIRLAALLIWCAALAHPTTRAQGLGEASTQLGEKNVVRVAAIEIQCRPILENANWFIGVRSAKQNVDTVCYRENLVTYDMLDNLVRAMRPYWSKKECETAVANFQRLSSPWRGLDRVERYNKLLSEIKKARETIQFPKDTVYEKLAWETLLPCMATVESGADLEPLSTALGNCSDRFDSEDPKEHPQHQTSRGLFHMTRSTMEYLIKKAENPTLTDKQVSLLADSMQDLMLTEVRLQVTLAASIFIEKYRVAATRKDPPKGSELLRSAIAGYNAAQFPDFYAQGVLACQAALPRGEAKTDTQKRDVRTALQLGTCVAHPQHAVTGAKPDLAFWEQRCRCIYSKGSPEADCNAGYKKALAARDQKKAPVPTQPKATTKKPAPKKSAKEHAKKSTKAPPKKSKSKR